MCDDPAILVLHDRATRGDVLSPEEHAQLEQWYAAHDAAEHAMLQFSRDDGTAVDVQSQIAEVLDRCQMLSQRIQELTLSNQEAQQEIMRLRQRLHVA